MDTKEYIFFQNKMEEASDGSFEDGAPTRILARTILANNELHFNAHEPISQSCLPYTVSTPKLKLYLSNNNDDTTYIDLSWKHTRVRLRWRLRPRWRLRLR